jgi:anaphase-promoting complex subunit 1
MLETCLNVAVLSLGLVMAGTGDLAALRVLRALHARVVEVTYGCHMAVSMAIGYLFLGGGTCTFDNSNESVAALVAACYPVFPTACWDNRYHLQAMRHLHALAIVPRALVLRDIDTRAPCYAPVTVALRSGFAVLGFF